MRKHNAALSVVTGLPISFVHVSKHAFDHHALVTQNAGSTIQTIKFYYLSDKRTSSLFTSKATFGNNQSPDEQNFISLSDKTVRQRFRLTVQHTTGYGFCERGFNCPVLQGPKVKGALISRSSQCVTNSMHNFDKMALYSLPGK